MTARQPRLHPSAAAAHDDHVELRLLTLCTTRRAALAIIFFYKAAISPLLPKSCRFLPTCSSVRAWTFPVHSALMLEAVPCVALRFLPIWFAPWLRNAHRPRICQCSTRSRRIRSSASGAAAS